MGNMYEFSGAKIKRAQLMCRRRTHQQKGHLSHPVLWVFPYEEDKIGILVINFIRPELNFIMYR